MRNASPSVMWLNQDRVFYVGLLGHTTLRVFGAHLLYAAVDAPYEIRFDDHTPWQACNAAIVPPGMPHRVRTEGRRVATLLLEPEYLDAADLHEALGARQGVLTESDLPARFAELQRRIASGDGASLTASEDIDRALFARPLATRRCEPRIEAAVDQLRRQPFAVYSAAQGLAEAGLSYSRFLHLFKAEVGVSFRTFRSWKRARMLLQHMGRPSINFTQLALDSGYPDATHFSHSIRRIYGLNPRDIFQGSRRLAVHVAEGV